MTPLAQLTLLCLEFLPRCRGDEALAAIARWADLLQAVENADAPPLGDDAVTAERIRQEGVSQGITQSLSRGQAKTLLRLLHKRFGPLPDAAVARIQAASDAELDRLTDRILDVDSLDALFD